MRLLRLLTALLIHLGLLAACGSQPPDAGTSPTAPATDGTASAALRGELHVFAAASLTEAFGEIGAQFEAAHPGTRISFNFAGSQQLAQQIIQGAPADVFASANLRQLDLAIQAGQVISGTERTFVRNRLVVIYPRDNPASLQSLADLARPGVKLVLAASAVPVGGYSLDFLDKASQLPEYTAAYSPTVLSNVVSYEENVRAVLSKVVLGEADAGIVYSSDVALGSADRIAQIDIPDALNTVAAYPIAPIAGSQSPTLAGAFIDYVLSPGGQAVLAKYGFIPIDG